MIIDRVLFESVEQSGRLRNDYFRLTDQDRAFLLQLSGYLSLSSIETMVLDYLDSKKRPPGDLSGMYEEIIRGGSVSTFPEINNQCCGTGSGQLSDCGSVKNG